jgi:hypothetical protein
VLGVPTREEGIGWVVLQSTSGKDGEREEKLKIGINDLVELVEDLPFFGGVNLITSLVLIDCHSPWLEPGSRVSNVGVYRWLSDWRGLIV